MADTETPESEETLLQQSKGVIEDTAQIFCRYLLSDWSRKKTPYGLDGALAEASTAGPDVTTRIFLTAGFSAWIAYFLASTGEGHYEGRHAQLQAITTFNQLSIEERTLVAKRVAETVPHPTVKHAIDKMLQEPKRRRLLSQTSDREVRAQPNLTSPVHSLDSAAVSLLSPTRRNLTPVPDLSQNVIGLNSSQHQQVLSHASLQGTADLFPEYMSGAIRRDAIQINGITRWKAAVTMAFPYVGKVDSLMSLAIKETKVEHIAMALFNVHVEVESAVQARQVVMQDGVRLMPNPEITLLGVQSEAIKKLFGLDIYNAIKASRVFQEELEQGTRATRCVSMIIPSNPRFEAIINLNLGLKEGSLVKNKLYRRFSDKGTID
ncbi:uncharacterized protein PV06_09732 [Exophiala oligosperma]|uniref:Uncharacterized protein n=1 Tax=Exophiala oligosperma TaxID=215243 RepID=A0A0D2ABL9_9EURO|nr:uncharacterized protein PV06_09732 [Exophiala oligosperma]KIW37736.1 hypothetical protein PV06_09732 [Exophiala oligosperma]